MAKGSRSNRLFYKFLFHALPARTVMLSWSTHIMQTTLYMQHFFINKTILNLFTVVLTNKVLITVYHTQWNLQLSSNFNSCSELWGNISISKTMAVRAFGHLQWIFFLSKAVFSPDVVELMRQYHQKIGDPEKRPPELKNLREEYDFIVIGKEESSASILRRALRVK